jgi:hypothetical protein
MTPVLFSFITPTGSPIANTEALIQLSKSGFDEVDTGVVMPREIVATTDENGNVTVNLWPSSIMYHLTMTDPLSDVALHYKFYVPFTDEMPVRLQDIVVDLPVSTTTYDEQAIYQILTYKSLAGASAIAAGLSEIAAAASAAEAVAQVTFIGDSVTDTAANVAAAQQALSDTETAADAGAASAVASAASAVVAGTWADTAEGFADQAQALVPTMSATPPVSPVPYATWMDSETGKRYVWFEDGDSSQWVETSTVITITVQEIPTDIQDTLDLKAPLASPVFTGTVTGITKAMVGLTSVDDTSDAGKPVSSAGQTALDLKADIASPTFTGTVGGITKAMVGLTNVDDTTDLNKPISTATQTALDLKIEAGTFAPLASPAFTGTVTGITKAMVGLTSADDTTDADKPVSTATQTALDLKADQTGVDLKAPLASPTFTGTVAGVSKAMVGLTNADDTTDANKPVSTATQTALDLKSDTEVASTTKVASYILALVDAGTVVLMNVAGANTLTIPPNATVAFPIGTVVIIHQYGAGTTTVTAGAGVTLRSKGSLLAMDGQYSFASLYKQGTDEWLVTGNLV